MLASFLEAVSWLVLRNLENVLFLELQPAKDIFYRGYETK